MRAVGPKVLKNKLSEYVDHVVAELVPPREGRSPLLADALLAEAVRRGWVSAPALVAEGPPPRAPVAPLADLLAELDRDRADR